MWLIQYLPTVKYLKNYKKSLYGSDKYKVRLGKQKYFASEIFLSASIFNIIWVPWLIW